MSQTLSVAPEKMIRSICLLLVFSCVVTTSYADYCPDGCASKAGFAKLRPKLNHLKDKNKENTHIVKELKRREERKVAFTAALETEGIAYAATDVPRILIYNKVITNLTDAYDPKTGIFTAPYPGVYVFIFFYHAGKECPVKLILYKNDKPIVVATDHQTSKDNSDNGGNSVVLELIENDRVSVHLGEYTHVWGSPHRQTTLSAFLLYPD